MTAADFVRGARAALSCSDDAGARHERQRDRATMAALRFQFGHLLELRPVLATLADESCNERERRAWLELTQVVLGDVDG